MTPTMDDQKESGQLRKLMEWQQKNYDDMHDIVVPAPRRELLRIFHQSWGFTWEEFNKCIDTPFVFENMQIVELPWQQTTDKVTKEKQDKKQSEAKNQEKRQYKTDLMSQYSGSHLLAEYHKPLIVNNDVELEED
jgi:hypothetical protein